MEMGFFPVELGRAVLADLVVRVRTRVFLRPLPEQLLGFAGALRLPARRFVVATFEAGLGVCMAIVSLYKRMWVSTFPRE